MNYKKIITNIKVFSLVLLYSVTLNISSVYGNLKESTESKLNFEDINKNIKSESSIVIDMDTFMPIFEKNPNEKLAPASTTKIMTALLTLEKANGNLEDRVFFSKEAVYSIEFGSSNIAMMDDETLSVEEALYAIMLPSANEVANALGEYVGGTKENFIKMMNAKAKELGALNTNFENANGLYEENHYTTAYDMAIIMAEACKYPEFLKIINTTSYEIGPTEKQEEDRIMHNSNKLIFESSEFYNPYVIGGKTGYTNLARHSIAVYADNGEHQLISVSLKGEKNEPYEDTNLLLEYGFESFEDIEIIKENAYRKTIDIIENNEVVGTLEVGAKEFNIELPISNNNFGNDTKLIFEENIPETIEIKNRNEVLEGSKIGKVWIYYEDREIGETDIVALKDGVFMNESEEVLSVNTGNNVNEIDIESKKININNIITENVINIMIGIFSLVIIIIFIKIILSLRKQEKRKYKYAYKSVINE